MYTVATARKANFSPQSGTSNSHKFESASQIAFPQLEIEICMRLRGMACVGKPCFQACDNSDTFWAYPFLLRFRMPSTSGWGTILFVRWMHPVGFEGGELKGSRANLFLSIHRLWGLVQGNQRGTSRLGSPKLGVLAEPRLRSLT